MTISNSSNSQFNGKFSVKNLYVSGKNTDEASLYITPKTTEKDGSIFRDIEINSTKNSNRTCINSNNLYLKSSLTNNILAKESISLISNFSNINAIDSTGDNTSLDSAGYYNSINTGNSLKMNATGIKLDSHSHSLVMDSSNIKMKSNNDINIESKQKLNIKTNDISIDSVNNLKVESQQPMEIITSQNSNSNITIKPNGSGDLILGDLSNNNATINSNTIHLNTTNIKINSVNDLDMESVKPISIKTTGIGSDINIIPETNGSLQLGKSSNKNTTIESNHIELTTSKDISGNPPGCNIELTGNDLAGYGSTTAGLVLQSNSYNDINNSNDSNGTIVAKCGKFTITGDLDVQGETTTLNTETTIIEDINIQLGAISREISLIENYIPKITNIEKKNNDVLIDLNQITDIEKGDGKLSWIKDSMKKTLECKIEKLDGKYKITDNNGNPIDNDKFNELNGIIQSKEMLVFDPINTTDSSGASHTIKNGHYDKYIELNTSERDDLKNIQAGDYIHIKGNHNINNISGNGPKKSSIDMTLKVKTVHDGSILLDLDDQPSNFDKNKMESIKNDMIGSTKPVISKLKTKEQVNNAGLDIEFFDNTSNVEKTVTKYIRYHSNSTNKTETENTWNVNAPIRMEPQDEIEDPNGDGKLMPITIGKRPSKPTDPSKKRGWSIIANDNSLIIRNEDSNEGEGQIVFTARSRD